MLQLAGGELKDSSLWSFHDQTVPHHPLEWTLPLLAWSSTAEAQNFNVLHVNKQL